jgi:galactose mutarotase-like enzyme
MSGPRFVGMTWRPDEGMRLVQAVADLPGLGDTELLVDAPFGGALLIPFANRIRGRLQPDGMLLTRILDRDVRLPANWRDTLPGAEPCAMHGLILQSRFSLVTQSPDHIVAELDTDFDGHWLSRAHIRVEATMAASVISISVIVRNIGDEVLPVGIGWHPYFRIPSGQRSQARVRIPARQRALVTNYDDVFPTGELAPVAGTPYDFTAEGDTALGSNYFDDCFTDLIKDEEGRTRIDVVDPASGYRMRVTALSPQVQAVQMYAPPEKALVVLEPQFNLADPFSPLWRAASTGMAILRAGDSAVWTVKWEVL